MQVFLSKNEILLKFCSNLEFVKQKKCIIFVYEKNSITSYR